MNFYYSTDERTARLIYQSELWLGTRWCSNSAVKGMGVSCHNLPREIYVSSGFLKSDFPQLEGAPSQASSQMEKFLDSRPEFLRLVTGKPQPGDLLGLRIKKGIDHLGVVLTEFTFVHVLMGKHTCLDNHNITPWLERTLAVWRPLE
jgi:hypothetical protein